MSSNEVEVAPGGSAGMSVMIGDPHEDGSKVVQDEQDTDAEIEKLPREGEEEEGDEQAGSEEGDDESQDGDDEEGGDAEDLGEFSEDRVEEFDARYVKDGKLDLGGSLSAEFWANAKAGKEGLNEGTYAYLEAKGISRADVKAMESMAKTQADAAANSVQAQDMALFDAAGGPDALKSALEWGKATLSKEERDDFNKTMAGKDKAAKIKAVKSLMFDYGKANPKERPALPKRDATKGSGKPAGGVKPFASRDEYRQAKREAGDNQAAIRRVQQRLIISDF